MNTFSSLCGKGIYNEKPGPLLSSGAKSFLSIGTQRKIPVSLQPSQGAGCFCLPDSQGERFIDGDGKQIN